MDIVKLKKETEELYLRIGNQINQKQTELNALVVEKTKIEGEYRLLEKIEKETSETNEETKKAK